MTKRLAVFILLTAVSVFAQLQINTGVQTTPGVQTYNPLTVKGPLPGGLVPTIGADPPQNPTYQGYIGGDPTVYQFCWTTNTPQQGRVMLGVAGTSGTVFPYRWIDNTTPSTNMCITVPYIFQGQAYTVALGACPTTSTCDQIDVNESATCPNPTCGWSLWNINQTMGNGPKGQGVFTTRPAPKSTAPLWRIIASPASQSMYQNSLLTADLHYLVQAIPSDSNTIHGVFTFSVSDGTNTYTCGAPTLSGSYYASGGDCMNGSTPAHIKVIAWATGTSPTTQSATPWIMSTIPGSFTSMAPTYTGHIVAGAGVVMSKWGQHGLSSGATATQGDFLGIITDASTAPGVWTITGMLHLYYASGNTSHITSYAGGTCVEQGTPPANPTGYGCNYSYFVLPITVVASPPTFVVNAPSSFPTPTYTNLYNPAILSYIAQDCKIWQAWNANGGWNNYLFSAVQAGTGAKYGDIWNYDGARVNWSLADYDNAVTATWTGTTAYALGAMVRASGITYIAMTGGTSGSSNPFSGTTAPFLTWPINDGTVVWASAGTGAEFNTCGYQIRQQYDNWALNAPIGGSGTGISEWNQFPWGALIDFSRQTDSKPQNWCQNYASGTCTGFSSQLIANLANTTLGNMTRTNQQTQTPQATIRPSPYGLDALIASWAATGTKPAQFDTYLNIALGQANWWINYSPYAASDTNFIGGDFAAGSNEYPCCFAVPQFDSGLLGEALIEAYIQEKRAGLTPDPRIEPTVHTFANRVWSKYVKVAHGNTSGAFLYAVFGMPPGTWNFGLNNLNTLTSPMMVWLWAMEGDSCTLTNIAGTTDTCLAAHDTMMVDAWNGTTAWGGFAKSNNQMFRSWGDDWEWRTNRLSPEKSVVMPEQQPAITMYADTLAPYPQAGTGFTAFPVSGSLVVAVGPPRTLTVSWITMEHLTAAAIQFGTTNHTATAGQLVSCNTGWTSTYYVGAKVPYSLWTNTCTVNLPAALTTGTTYYYSVKGTDAAGNSNNPSFANVSSGLNYTSTFGGASVGYCIENNDSVTLNQGCSANGKFVAP